MANAVHAAPPIRPPATGAAAGPRRDRQSRDQGGARTDAEHEFGYDFEPDINTAKLGNSVSELDRIRLKPRQREFQTCDFNEFGGVLGDRFLESIRFHQ
jgi:hypothetical protein